MYNLSVFVSGGGTNLQAIIDRIEDGSLNHIRIACVIASREHTGAEERARRAGLPVFVVNRKTYGSQEEFDKTLIHILKPYSIDLVVLAGYLTLLGPGFIDAFSNRVINVHPSLIPSFCGPGYYGIRPHEAALAYGVKVTGATVHLVDKQYDHGPIVMQKCVPVKPGDTPELLQKRVMSEAEHLLLPKAIALFAEGKIEVIGRKTHVKI
jgi:phosphoribosylglycinamide formyltransferase 1